MKTLIQNYMSGFSTEPLYFNQCLLECGLESHLWSDIFISHYKFLTNDILKYLRQTNRIQLILNITGASKEEVQSIEQVYAQYNIKAPFVFSNVYDFTNQHKPSKIRLVNIMPCVDIFLPPVPAPDFKIDTAIISTNNNELVKQTVKDKEVYHLLSLGAENEDFDLSVDVRSIMGLYNKYNEIVLVDDVNIVTSQILFETSLKAQKVSVKVIESQQSALDKILATLFHAGDDLENPGEIIRNQIKKKHTCFNRTARLTRFLKNEEASQKLQSISDKI